VTRSWRPPRAVPPLVGVCILGALLYFAGGTDVLAAARRCTPAALVGAATAIVCGTVLGAWNVYRIAGLQASMPFARFLPVYWRSWAVGITVPGQVGDMLTTLWQLRGRTGGLAFIAGRLVADKAVTLGAMLALAAMLPMVMDRAGMLLSLVLLGAVALAALAGYASLRWCERHATRWRWGRRLQPVLAAAVELPFGTVALNAAVTVAKVLLSGLAYWLLLRAMVVNAPGFPATVVVSQSAGLVAYLPISFNGIGTVELSAIALFRTIDLDSAAVLSAYLILRAITLVAAWLPAAWWTRRKPALAG
jgi:uncharacterized membrane protein YbhN (UPF0104 family)